MNGSHAAGRCTVDELLSMLHAHGLNYRPNPHHVDRWEAVCSCCGDSSLSIREHGDPLLDDIPAFATVRCLNGCGADEILGALRRDPERIELLRLVERMHRVASEAVELAAELVAPRPARRPHLAVAA